MKGFGNNNKTKKKSKEKKDNSLQKDKLISNALSLHSKGKIKEALEIYNFLIQNKIYDPRVLNNLGSLYSQLKQFDKAISSYAGAQKQLMEEAQMFINNSSSSGPASEIQSKLIRSEQGTIGYVTDKNTFKYVGSPDTLKTLYANNGCPAQYEQTDLDIKARIPSEGNVTGSDPNLFIGNPMKAGQSCVPTSINFQVMGNTNPNFNKADWLGCYKSSSVSSNFDKNDDMPNSDDPEMCRVRAADLGSSAFYINNSQCCDLAPKVAT